MVYQNSNHHPSWVDRNILFYSGENTWENIYCTYLKIKKSLYMERAVLKTLLDDFS